MLSSEQTPLSLVVLISGRGSNLQAILDAISEEGLPARVEAVISNVPDAQGLLRAKKAGIPTAVKDHRKWPQRELYDQQLIKVIDHYAPGLVVLAGFMRILTPQFVAHYSGRLINIHPSLLPAYRGLNTHARVLEAGETHHGASVHFVTAELDSGPVIHQDSVAINREETAATLQHRIHRLEHKIYPQAIRWLAEGRGELVEGKVVVDHRPTANT